MQACKFAMRVCAPVVGSEQITAMFQNHLHDDKSLHYGEFINDLTKYLVRYNKSTKKQDWYLIEEWMDGILLEIKFLAFKYSFSDPGLSRHAELLSHLSHPVF